MLALRLCSLVLAAGVLCSLYGAGGAAVIAIDFGSEWMKIALVKVSLGGRNYVGERVSLGRP